MGPGGDHGRDHSADQFPCIRSPSMVERYLTYTAAKKQSRGVCPALAQALKNIALKRRI